MDQRLQQDHRADDHLGPVRTGRDVEDVAQDVGDHVIDRRNDDDQETDGDPADQPPPGGSGEPGDPLVRVAGQGDFRREFGKDQGHQQLSAGDQWPGPDPHRSRVLQQ